MMTIMGSDSDYLGRDVPGGNRYTRAGGLWHGEKELWGERMIGDAVVDDDNDGSDGDLAKMGRDWA